MEDGRWEREAKENHFASGGGCSAVIRLRIQMGIPTSRGAEGI
jgi:hypothetical protein